MVLEQLSEERIENIKSEIDESNQKTNWKKLILKFPLDKNSSVLKFLEDISNKGVYFFETELTTEEVKALYDCSSTKIPPFNEGAISKILYVGSSSTLKTRFKTHLGIVDHKGNSSNGLWLNEWYKGKITLFYYEGNIKSVLKLMETEIYESNKPILGQDR